MAATVLPLFRAEYGRLIRRELVLRFDVLAWVWYAEDEGMGIEEVGKSNPEQLIKGLCWAAYRSHCAQEYKRPTLTRKRLEYVIDNLPRKKSVELLQHIQGVKIFGKTPEEHAEAVGVDSKKKSRKPGGS
jgi:hypothetical protein